MAITATTDELHESAARVDATAEGTASAREAEPGFLAQLAFAAHLDPEPYRIVARDSAATWKVALLVVAACAARGWAAYPQEGAAGLLGSTAVGVSAWLLLATIVWALGRPLATASAGWWNVLRGLGFAAWPLLCLGMIGAAGIWTLGLMVTWINVLVHAGAVATFVVATREVLQVTTARAAGIAALALVIVAGAVLMLLTPALLQLSQLIELVLTPA